MSAWTSGIGALLAGAGAVTILHGSSFVISGANGDIDGLRPHGFFFHDTRFVSRWHLQINGMDLEPLSGMATEPYRAVFVGRLCPNTLESNGHLLVERRRFLDGGFTERIVLHNHSNTVFTARILLEVEADFADLFDVKAGRTRPRHGSGRRPDTRSLEYRCTLEGRQLGVSIRDRQGTSTDRGLAYTVKLAPQGVFTTRINVEAFAEGQQQYRDAGVGPVLASAASLPARREQAWQERIPSTEVQDPAVDRALLTGRRDLGSLRIFDSAGNGGVVVAAGAPWFMALFGRDSLLTSLMALPVDASLALGTIQTLARFQGTGTNAATEEEPGKILHELRTGLSSAGELGVSGAYFGSVDTTALFVVLAGELIRWGMDGPELQRLMPAIDRAMDWIERKAAEHPKGFLAYHRTRPTGLANQGWKDSWDGVVFADGTIAQSPLALCEVQGYVYNAHLARALMAQLHGDKASSQDHVRRARDLKTAFNEEFWLEDRGYYALALDAENRPVDSCASNMGHCLFSGIIDQDKAPLVARRLMSKDMFSGWGVRTLSTKMRAYNPASYHNGSIWPHDNALIAGGLMRYGFIEDSQRIATAMMEAAEFFDGRLPELFCGLDRTRHPAPVPYPTACSPQAWAAATPMHLLRVMLRLEPFLHRNTLYIDPVLPPQWGEVTLRNITMGQDKISLHANRDQVRIEGAPSGLRVVHGPHGPWADLADAQANT